MHGSYVTAVLFSGSKVQISEDKNTLSQKVWVSSKKNIYSAPNSKVVIGYVKSGVIKKDKYINLSSNAAKDSYSKDIQKSLSKIEGVYIERCGSCHRLFEAKEYTYNKWLASMDSMKFHAGLSETEHQRILHYLYLLSSDNN